MKYTRQLLVLMALLLLSSQVLTAQYFGRNKANYESFDFDVVQTPNFELYYYLDNPDVLRDMASYAEIWYNLHQNVLGDTIVNKNPFILYSNHADFQQTNTISGNVGVGTGGVTEAFKNRVIMPIAMANQSTIQVMGHELVHAYQFNSIIQGDSTSLQSLGNLPLWIVEGMAEYMSIGSVDPHTAMWMRDAVLNDDVPSLQDMNNPRYFPYRYGHAFWSFFTGIFGDEKIKPFFRNVAKYGVEVACQATLGVTRERLSELWEQSLKEQFKGFVQDKEDGIIGRSILDEEDGGRLNISPSISPNGRYVLFTSERNLFSTDIFLADANSGEVLKTIASTTREGNIDNFNFIESSGAWSPNSKQVAYVGFKQGDNILIVKNIEDGKTVIEKKIPGLNAFSNPAWSPDGKHIVLQGLREGQIDLYLYNIRTEGLQQLTDDPYSELHPIWHADGERIVYSTDELAWQRGRTYGRLTYNLAEMKISQPDSAENYEVFFGADNLNPVIDTAGNIVFLSNRDGYRNMYRLVVDSGKVYQLTDIATGISGISHYSPAISAERRRDRIVYTHYNERGYSIYRARSKALLKIPVDPQEVTYKAAKLPRNNDRVNSIVDAQIRSLDQIGKLTSSELDKVPFKSKFQLDYIGGGAGIGVGTGNTFGTQSNLAGAVQMQFSDILGNNQFFVNLALNGEIYDFGGTVTYVNRKNQLNWGGTLSHIPFRQTFLAGNEIDTPDFGGSNVLAQRFDFLERRLFIDQVGGFVRYPFSTTLRAEFDLDFARYSERVELISNFYDQFGRLLQRDEDKLDSAPGFNLYSAGMALVKDNSYFGLTAPLDGIRFRFSGRQTVGESEFFTGIADFRIYRLYRPVSLAFRAMHIGRYGIQQDNGTGFNFENNLGFPGFLRGFDFATQEELIVNGELSDANFNGTKIVVSNFEVRIPFTGPEQLALINSSFLFSDLNFFIDGGLAWNDSQQFNEDANLSGLADAEPIFSAGVSLRVNLFGALVVEPYYAKPLVGDQPFSFGFNFIPGW